MKTYNIAALPGDGIGKEIMPCALDVLHAAAAKSGFQLAFEAFPWGCEYYLETGKLMPRDGVGLLRPFHALYFVAAGHPDVTDYLSAWEFIFIMRKQFKQYVNIRPIKAWSGVPTLLADQAKEIDFVIVRENSEGEYAGPGGFVHPDFENGVAVQTSIFTRQGIERIARFAFELARTRRSRVTNVTKSNAMLHSLVYWDRIVAEVSRDYPDVEYEMLYVDAATMKFLQKPEWFDVIVTTNLFGDILSDLGGAMIGSIGLGPSANVNPDKMFPSLFEPVHGSAPDIAGKGIANPIATILAGGMMLQHLGEPEAAALIEDAVAQVLMGDVRSGDLGGTATTGEISDAIVGEIEKL
ncbi:MAG: tartrate dehydrogenase [Chloroflexi bacterium]|nr:MAG: tartrate dehydrogenase [Chloroflexota bacterium]